MSRTAPVQERPDPGLRYTAMVHRTRPGALLAVALLAVAGFVIISSLFSQGLLTVGWFVTGRPGELADHLAAGLAFETPLGMVATNLALGSTIAVAVGCLRLLGLGPGWLVSVAGTVRLRWAVVCLLPAVIIFGVLGALGLGAGEAPSPYLWAFVVVIVLTVPTQAIAEELIFRGVLAQALGGIGGAVLGIVGPALVFALLHGAQDVWLFCNRFGFGIVAGVIVWCTGGLEAVMVAHVVNNLIAFGIAAFGPGVAAARTMATMTPTDALLGLAGYLVFGLVVVAVQRVRGPIAVTG
ncbi:CPBP family intramembrane glutamic endopeptidase [Naumannella halotolerans]|uniref:CPBP family intramembrane glutamic endopeptidase n=1 Tax=Naumannella halotolerans TaxID=993414 RepID=UPI00370DB34E